MDAPLVYQNVRVGAFRNSKYIDKLNAALEKYPELQNKKLEELLGDLEAVPEAIRTAVRNHGGGHWNHSFFWKILGPASPAGGQGSTLTEEIKKQFKDSALACFGSGWFWLDLVDQKTRRLIIGHQYS